MKFAMSISRNSKERVSISIQCKTSRMQFLELDLSLEEYASILTGLSHVEVEGEVKGLDKVGKTRVREDRSVTVANDIGNRGKAFLQEWLIKNCQEDGWTLETYLGSQKSVVYNGEANNCTINYSVFKYVDNDVQPS